MRVRVGDLIMFKYDDPQEPDSEPSYYLITKTRNHFRYEAISIGDGCLIGLDKAYVQKYGEIVKS